MPVTAFGAPQTTSMSFARARVDLAHLELVGVGVLLGGTT
jgi:hypothetical protein